MELRGRVHIRADENTIIADTVHVDLDRSLITAEGHLTWEGEDHRASGARMTFNLKTRTGEVEDVTLMTGPWIVRTPKVDQPDADTILVRPGVITTCDAPRPHYSIRCHSLKIRLKQDLTAVNVTVLVGNTPVFWLPILATPLKEFRLPFEAQVGRTRELGAFVRASPAYSFTPEAPGRLHLDYFQRTGWGAGFTQDLMGPKDERRLRLHAWGIRERTPSRPDVPRGRWDLSGESTLDLPAALRLTSRVDALSDAHAREQYGQLRLGLPASAGERRASALLVRSFPAAEVSVQTERVDTLRLAPGSLPGSTDGRYALSSVTAPRVEVAVRPHELAPAVSASSRVSAARTFAWRDGWYVNEASVAPMLEISGRLPGLGSATWTPRLTAEARDRGNRVLRVEDGRFAEDANRGLVLHGDSGASLRRPLLLGVQGELTHSAAARLNKIGYDPYHYRGLEQHTLGARLSHRLGESGMASLSDTYDLRDRQDPRGRRFGPLVPEASATPERWATVTARAEYDTWFRRWRGGSATVGLGVPDGLSPILHVSPRYTDNRVPISLAAQAAQDYRIAQALYGASADSLALGITRIFTVDADGSLPLPFGVTFGATGQWDGAARRLAWYTLSATRNLHCWDLVGTFQHFASGEYRFIASLGLSAFPGERVPVLGL